MAFSLPSLFKASTPAQSAASGQSDLFRQMTTDTIWQILTRLPDPDLILQKAGLGRWELRKLETDDEISAALETRRDAVISTPWLLDPYESTEAQWLASELDGHMDAALGIAWNAVPYGYSIGEIVYRQSGGRTGIDRVVESPIEWFEPRRDGTLWMQTPGYVTPQQVDTDLKFFCTVRRPSYRNPYGEALLTRVYWPWFFRLNGWRFWMQFLERFADPLLLGQVYNPTQFTEEMRKLGLSAVVGVAKDEQVTAVTSGGSGEFSRVEEALVQRIQKVILGQTLTSQMGSKGGSFAAAKVHDNVRDDKRRADLRLVTKSMQWLVNALWTVNGFGGPAPLFKLQDERGLESDRADRDAKLVQAGAIKFTRPYFLNNYDLEEDEFEIPTGAAPSNPNSPQDPAHPDAEDAADEADPNDNEGAENARAQLAADKPDYAQRVTPILASSANPLIQAMLERIRHELDAAHSLDQFQQRITELYPTLQRTDLVAVLGQAFSAAHLAGRFEASQ